MKLPDRARGFTLVEVLVALIIVALGLTALLVAVNGTARTSGFLRDKSLGQWIALNRLSEVRLNMVKFGQNTDTGELDFGNVAVGSPTTLTDTITIDELLKMRSGLYGYTADTVGERTISWPLVQSILAHLTIPVVVEGHITDPVEVGKALALGAHAVVVGSAITRPETITARFAKSCRI